MGAICWNNAVARLKGYGVSVKDTKHVLKIEVEFTDPGHIGCLIETLTGIEREQCAATKSSTRPNRRPDNGD